MLWQLQEYAKFNQSVYFVTATCNWIVLITSDFVENYEFKIPTYQGISNTMNQCLISIQNQNTLKCSFYFFIALWFYENSKILCEETAAIQYRMLHLIFFFGMVISGMLLLNVTQIRFYLDKFFIFVLLNGSYYWQYECNYTFL